MPILHLPPMSVRMSSGAINSHIPAAPPKYASMAKKRAASFSSPRARKENASGAVEAGKEAFKYCTNCNQRKPLSCFPANSDSSDGKGAYCRDCKSAISKNRRMLDATARFTHYIVTRIRNEFPKEEVPKDIETNLSGYLGYELWELRKAQRQILASIGMTLIRSFKEGWHLDHVRPLSSFPKHKVGDDVFKQCWALENLRMIPAVENLQKGAKNIETLTEIAQKAAESAE